jgi:hypothetical protein
MPASFYKFDKGPLVTSRIISFDAEIIGGSNVNQVVEDTSRCVAFCVLVTRDLVPVPISEHIVVVGSQDVSILASKGIDFFVIRDSSVVEFGLRKVFDNNKAHSLKVKDATGCKRISSGILSACNHKTMTIWKQAVS